jgi:hypothetical protein
VTRARPGVPATGLLFLVLAVALGLAVGACGTGTTSPSPASPTPASSDSPAPRATPWTGNAVLGIEAMGLADGEIRKGMDDFNAAIQANDPAHMLQAAKGLAGVDVLLANVDRIEPFEPMREFAAAYREAISLMSSAAKELRTALEAGDGPAVTAASQKLIAGFTKYALLQGQLADYVVQVPDQKRILVR